MPSSSLLIIGNGFDLACGLKTRYVNVYPEYKKSKSDSLLIDEFKKRIYGGFIDWSDFELGMAEYAKTLNTEEELMSCVNDFNQYMHNYLLNVQQGFHKVFDQILSDGGLLEEMKKSINSLGKDVTHDLNSMIEERQANNPFNLALISFNYTDVFDSIFSKTFQNKRHYEVLHVHGVLNDDTVLGVDNESQISVRYNITNQAKICFVKPYFNSVFDSRRVAEAKALIEKAHTIFVYGASLGVSDLTWRNALLNWLKIDERNHLFYYSYEFITTPYKTKQERINLELSAKYELLNRWDFGDVNAIINRLHIPIGTNIFNFEPILKRYNEASDIINAYGNIKLNDI